MFDDFSTRTIATNNTTIYARIAGSGPPLLLLHGFPQTHLMWRDVAPILARACPERVIRRRNAGESRVEGAFTVVCADLRGYGSSGCPSSTEDHAPYAKRTMAADMIGLMQQLGFPQFAVAGHDRGGRVAYRLALDHPERVTRIAVLDVLPTEVAWTYADARFAVGYWPWALLAQPPPLPEKILSAAADAIVDNALDTWGTPVTIPHAVRQAYVDMLRDPAHAHAICEEYRAGASIDRTHDRADAAAGQRIRAPMLALWSAGGPLDTWYGAQSGPLAIWKEWAEDVGGHSMAGGHFFPEQSPQETAQALASFFAAG